MRWHQWIAGRALTRWEDASSCSLRTQTTDARVNGFKITQHARYLCWHWFSQVCAQAARRGLQLRPGPRSLEKRVYSTRDAPRLERQPFLRHVRTTRAAYCLARPPESGHHAGALPCMGAHHVGALRRACTCLASPQQAAKHSQNIMLWLAVYFRSSCPQRRAQLYSVTARACPPASEMPVR